MVAAHTGAIGATFQTAWPRAIIERITASQGSPPEMGYLPPVNAATILTGKLDYLSFRNGHGIRYLVQITQDASPPRRDYTGYTLPGLTDDGRYYVAAFFSAFPPTIAPIQPPLANDIGAYYPDVIDRFDRISNDAHTPDPDSLDRVIGSLSVHPTNLNQLPGLPDTGDEAQVAKTGSLLVLTGLFLLCGGLALLRRAKAEPSG